MSAPTAKPDDPATDDRFGFALGILCATMGALLILLVVLARAAAQSGGEIGSGVVIPYANFVLGGGVFLFVLGTLLVSPKLASFFGQQRGLEALNQLLLVVLGAALLGLVNYVFARHDLWRWDVTSDQVFSLSEEARAVARGMKVETRLTFVPSEGTMRPSELDVMRTVLEGLDAESDRISARITRALDLMSPQEQMKLFEELETPNVKTSDEVLGVTLKLGHTEEGGRWVTERSRLLRWDELWQDPMMTTGRPGPKTFVGEQKLVSTLRELMEPEKPKVYFIEGHDERKIGDFDERTGLSSLVKGLRERNWAVETLVLGERPNHDVPADARAVLLAGPRLSLPEADVAAIATWVAQGGFAVVMADPTIEGRSRDKLRWVKSGLEPWLEKEWGVHPLDRVIYKVQVTGEQMGQMTGDYMPIVDTWSYGDGTHQAVKELAASRAPVLLNAARPLKLAPVPGVEQDVLLEVKAPPQAPENLISAPAPVRALLDPNEPKNEFGGPFVLGVACERPLGTGPNSKRARLVVFGDAEVAVNGAVDYPSMRNLELLLGVVNWGTGREYEIVGKVTRPRSYRLTLQTGQLEFFSALSLAGMPALAIALGIVAWMLRRGGAA